MEVTSKVKAFCRAAFPEWKGRKFRVVVSDRPIGLISIWDSGSRDEFVGMEIADGWAVMGRRVRLPVSTNPFQPLREDYIPRAGVAVVERSTFCGKDGGCTLRIHPDDAASFAD